MILTNRERRLSTSMRLLILSLDQSLLLEKERQQGDTLNRFKSYARKLDRLWVLVPTTLNFKKKAGKETKFSILGCYGFNKPMAYLNLWKKLFQITSIHNFEVIDSNDALLGVLAVLLRKISGKKIKVGVNAFGLEIFEKSWLKERWQNRLLKMAHVWSYKEADMIRTDNNRNKEMLIRRLNIDPEKIEVIPVFPSKQSFKQLLRVKKNEGLRREYLKKEKQYLIIAIGNLEKAKDYPTLLKAFKKVVADCPQAYLVIAGEGSERASIERFIKRHDLGSFVNLLGSMGHSQIPELLVRADLFVLSSAHEGLPRTLMEACLAKVPVVTTNIHGAEHLITPDISGKVVPVKNNKALAKAIIFMLNHPKQARLFGKRAQKNAKKFLDFDKNVERLINYWQRLAKNK